MAAQEQKSSKAEQIGKQVGSKVGGQLGRMATAKVTAAAIGRTVGGMVGTALGGIGGVVGGLVGGAIAANAYKAGQNVAKAAIYLPAALAGSMMAIVTGLLSIAVNSVFMAISWTVAGVALIAVLASFILFIINNSAYIVPPGVSFSNLGSFENVEATYECLNFTGPWPEDAIATELQAAQIIFDANAYASTLCAGGPITVIYSLTQEGGLGGRHLGNRQIRIYPLGTGSLGNTLYTLTHELGHVYASATGTMTAFFQNVPRSENSGCTYPFATADIEYYVESITVYSVGPDPLARFGSGLPYAVRYSNCFPDGFNNNAPVTWTWLRNNIFQSSLSW